MFGFMRDIRLARRAAGTLTALAVLFATIQPSHAQSLVGSPHSRGPAVYGGHAAMFDVRIALGGDAKFRSQPTLGFSVGPSWRSAPGAQYPGFSHFMPTAEARWTFSGDPVLKLGAFDTRTLRAAAEEGDGSTFCGRNLVLCIGGGVLVAAVVGFAIWAGNVDDWCTPTFCGLG
jgi:hypothetical protein